MLVTRTSRRRSSRQSGPVASALADAWARAQPRGSGHAPGDNGGLVVWGNLLATAGRHGLVFDRAWFVELYHHSSSCDFQAPLKYVAAVLARGSFSTESLVQIAAVVGLTGPELRRFDDESPADRLASQKAVLDALRPAYVPPLQYAKLLQEYWAGRATAAAGIDADAWDPANGVAGNRKTIDQVYEYYGRLFLAHPELRWAGMANLVGPGFAAGFLDLSMMRAIARRIASTIEHANPLPGAGKVVAGTVVPALGGLEVDAKFAETVAHMSDADLKFYETTFLKMQRDILRDMGGLQEAYLADPDGLTAVRELASSGLIRPAVMTAFERIRAGRDSGHGETVRLLDQAAQALARREQFDVIAQSWDNMREHRVDGEAMTYFMTVVGQPSVPGARSPGQVSPLRGTVRVPVPVVLPGPLPVPVRVGQVDVTGQVPLPDFNVSNRNSRWRFFLADTLPAALKVLDGPRSVVNSLVSSSLDDRIAEQRITRRLPAITEQLGPDHWHVSVKS